MAHVGNKTKYRGRVERGVGTKFGLEWGPVLSECGCGGI